MTSTVPSPDNSDRPDLSQYSLQVTWFEVYREDDFRLDEVEAVQQMMKREGLSPESFTTDCDDLVVVLEALAPFAEDCDDEIVIDGVDVAVGTGPDGGYCFVPESEQNGVEVLASNSASSNSGFACMIDESEKLLRYGDLYWVETLGDLDQQRVVVGRFTDPSAGLAAAAEASFYYTLDPDGRLRCELNTWSEDE
jgi:hypothetical protein